MDLPEIHLEKPGQIFLSPVSGQKSAFCSVSHRNNQSINNCAFSTVDALEVINENACVDQRAFSIHVFLPLSSSQGHPASQTCLYNL
jgi:hypothetical protein